MNICTYLPLGCHNLFSLVNSWNCVDTEEIFWWSYFTSIEDIFCYSGVTLDDSGDSGSGLWLEHEDFSPIFIKFKKQSLLKYLLESSPGTSFVEVQQMFDFNRYFDARVHRLHCLLLPNTPETQTTVGERFGSQMLRKWTGNHCRTLYHIVELFSFKLWKNRLPNGQISTR